jgi:hypothetical protein
MNSNALSVSALPERATSRNRSLVRFLPAIPRVLLGLPMAVFGLNAFLNFIPPPSAPLPEGAAAFSAALFATGYMLPLIGATQFVAGAMLLVNRFVPLALLLLAPFFVNAVAFHVFLEPSGRGPVAIFAALELVLLWLHRRPLLPLLATRGG